MPSGFPNTRAALARCIDHTLLKPEATAADIEKLCVEAREYGFFGVCVNPIWVPRCAELLRGTPTCVVSVAGFPLGASTTSVKALEAKLAVEQGAAEVDMVVNLAALRAGDREAVIRDIAEVVAAVKRVNERALVKVILETRALTTEQIILGCRCAAEARADFVKTSTGFHPAGGATVAHVALCTSMRPHFALSGRRNSRCRLRVSYDRGAPALGCLPVWPCCGTSGADGAAMTPQARQCERCHRTVEQRGPTPVRFCPVCGQAERSAQPAGAETAWVAAARARVPAFRPFWG